MGECSQVHARLRLVCSSAHPCAGSFLEASAQSTEAATLAAATLELMRCGRVHNHPEPFVRRAALLAAGQVRAMGCGGGQLAKHTTHDGCLIQKRSGAAQLLKPDIAPTIGPDVAPTAGQFTHHRSQVLGAVPPARLATAMLSSAAGSAPAGVALSAASAARDAADEALVSRLEWLRGWTEQVAEKDPDDSCRQGNAWVDAGTGIQALPMRAAVSGVCRELVACSHSWRAALMSEAGFGSIGLHLIAPPPPAPVPLQNDGGRCAQAAGQPGGRGACSPGQQPAGVSAGQRLSAATGGQQRRRQPGRCELADWAARHSPAMSRQKCGVTMLCSALNGGRVNIATSNEEEYWAGFRTTQRGCPQVASRLGRRRSIVGGASDRCVHELRAEAAG